MAENRKNYLWVAERLRDKIINEEWLPSEKILPERELSEKFGVARVTIRRALRVLESENLIRRIRGSGTYVNPKSSRRIPLMIDYAGSINTYAPKMKRELVKKDIIWADERLAADLKVKPESEILYAERLDHNGEGVVAYDKVYIPMSFSMYLTDEILEEIEFLEKWSNVANFQINQCVQYIEAIRADELSKSFLGLDVGSPILKSTEYYHNDTNNVVGMFVSFYHPEKICISSTFNWKEKNHDT